MGKREPPTIRGPQGFYVKLAVFAALISAAGLFYYFFNDQLQLEYLARNEARLRDYKESHPIWVFLLAFLIYVGVTGLSLPGALGLSVAYAWYFGFFPALILISISSTTGATLAFLLSRYFFRDFFERKFGDRLATFNENLRRDGAFYLFSLRLIPAVPFFLINIVMGLTPIRVTTFWWVSQLGMLPGTIVFVFFGSSFPDLQTLSDQGLGGLVKWEIMVAFVLLGVTPLIIRKSLRFYRAKHPSSGEPSQPPAKEPQ